MTRGRRGACRDRIERAECFLTNTGARVEHGGDRAYYRPSTDTIHMPDEGLFVADTASMTRREGYYATRAHETVHWSGAKHRLNGEFGKRFGDRAYAAEELVAEIGSAFLSSELQITQDVRPDHCAISGSMARTAERRSQSHLHGRGEGGGQRCRGATSTAA
jgi:antirestriction protein ArdC